MVIVKGIQVRVEALTSAVSSQLKRLMHVLRRVPLDFRRALDNPPDDRILVREECGATGSVRVVEILVLRIYVNRRPFKQRLPVEMIRCAGR